MCRVSRPRAVAGLRWHTAHRWHQVLRAPRGSRVAGLRRVALFSAHATYRSLVGHCSGVAWSGAGAAASFAWSLALEAESAAIEGEDADHHGEAVVHQPG